MDTEVISENFKNIKQVLVELTDEIAQVPDKSWSVRRKTHEKKRMKLILELQEKYKFSDEDLAAFIRLTAWEAPLEDKKLEPEPAISVEVVPENPTHTN